jgi:hypothetical protein
MNSFDMLAEAIRSHFRTAIGANFQQHTYPPPAVEHLIGLLLEAYS